MSEAGFGPKKPLTVQLEYGTSENRKRILVAIAAMWKRLGVNVELVNVEQQVHWANMRQGNFEVGWTGWTGDYDDAQDFLVQWQTSSKQLNFARFSNPDYDRLMDEASVMGDVAKRAQLLAQAEQFLLKEMPAALLRRLQEPCQHAGQGLGRQFAQHHLRQESLA
jgi:oligopeptide transport system substrate-binding protein